MNKKVKQINKREKILYASINLFRRTHDVKKVSMETIAAEARVSPTTIYNNFGTRDNLIFEVVKALIRENLDRNTVLVNSDLPFPRKLAGIISGKVNLVNKYNQEIIDKMVSQDKTVAPFVNKIYEEEIRPLCLTVLNDGKKQGYIDPALDDEALLIYLDVLKTGYSSNQELTKNIANNVDLLMQLTRIMFYGFLKKEIELVPKEDS